MNGYILCALCVMAIGAAGRPRHARSLSRVKRTEMLDLAQNKTYCPFRVVQNVDEYREPKVIKEVECILDALDICCFQLVDKVNVVYLNKPDTIDEITISVGCSCMVEQASSSFLEREEPIY